MLKDIAVASGIASKVLFVRNLLGTCSQTN